MDISKIETEFVPDGNGRDGTGGLRYSVRLRHADDPQVSVAFPFFCSYEHAGEKRELFFRALAKEADDVGQFPYRDWLDEYVLEDDRQSKAIYARMKAQRNALERILGKEGLEEFIDTVLSGADRAFPAP